MKPSLFLFFLLLVFTSSANAQTKNTVSLSYGFGSADVYRKTMGGASFDNKGQMSIGLGYQRKLVHGIGLESGIYYSVNKIQSTSEFFPNIPRTVTTQNIKLISVPLYVNISFLKYLYSNVGLTADFESGRPSNAIAPNQSGIGVGLGIGGKYTFSNFSVFVNPLLQVHRVVAFESSGSGNLLNASVQTGIGYRF